MPEDWIPVARARRWSCAPFREVSHGYARCATGGAGIRLWIAWIQLDVWARDIIMRTLFLFRLIGVTNTEMLSYAGGSNGGIGGK